MREICEVLTDRQQRRLLLKLLALYLIVALPFKALDILPDFANIRPNSAFIPVYGYLFGPAGAWANALGNCFYDLLTGSFTKSSMAGNLANFCVPMLMCFLWRRLVGSSFRLTNVRELFWYVFIAVLGAIAKAFLITPAVVFFYPQVSGMSFANAVVATEVTFYLAPAIAILLVLQNIYGVPAYIPHNPETAPARPAASAQTEGTLNRLQADLCLLTVVLCWSFEIIIFKNIPDSVPGLSVTALTCLLGGFVLTVFFFAPVRRYFTLKLVWQVFPLAALNIVYNLLRFEATRFLPAHVTESTTTMALLIMPLLLWLMFREKQPWQVWAGGGIVLLGIAAALDWTFPMGQSYGLGLMLLFAIFWSVYIIWLNSLSKLHDPIIMTVLLLGMGGIISLLAWIFLLPETIRTIDYSGKFWASIFAYAYFSSIFATVLNVLVQKFVSPLDAVAIYSLGPAIVLIMAVALPPQLAAEFELTTMAVISCVIIVAGSILCQLDWKSMSGRKS